MSEDLKLLYNMINRVRNARSPGMYLGIVSLQYFQIFLDGYIQGQWEMSGKCPDSIQKFTAYVGKYFNDSANVGWAVLILKHAESEEEAFGIFYRLFDEYVKTRLVE